LSTCENRAPRKCLVDLTRETWGPTVLPMTARELRRILRGRDCVEVRQKGSHLLVRCGTCTTVIPVHMGEDLGTGLLRKIERDLATCLGDGWLSKGK
jgi:predicted RNA binding protein YcfA (HicA-like mRNA interferase family)